MKALFILICLLYGGVVVGMCELLPPATAIPLIGGINFIEFVVVLWLLLFWKIPYDKIGDSDFSNGPRTDPNSDNKV